MAYTDKNFKTKKALKEALANGEEIRCYNPSGMFPVATNGPISLEGPHYPEPHKWYASGTMKDDVLVSVK